MVTEAAGHKFDQLPPVAGRPGAVFAGPKVLAAISVIVLAGLGWFALALQAANVGLVDAICRALVNGQTSVGSVGLVAAMWGAMTLAMMLPSAAPMILTYAEVADATARKGEPAASPFLIVAGYAVVWFGFAVAATGAQVALTRLALLDASLDSASGLFSGAIFIGAGVYQFSALKSACLLQCRNPLQFFSAHWATTSRGAFKLGIRQGLFCLGCCWAMMLVMFAVGVMNVVWMAALGIVMALEKIGTGKRLTFGIGAGLIGIGIVFIVTSFVTHWPARII